MEEQYQEINNITQLVYDTCWVTCALVPNSTDTGAKLALCFFSLQWTCQSNLQGWVSVWLPIFLNSIDNSVST
jgi:hypothetical protein